MGCRQHAHDPGREVAEVTKGVPECGAIGCHGAEELVQEEQADRNSQGVFRGPGSPRYDQSPGDLSLERP